MSISKGRKLEGGRHNKNALFEAKLALIGDVTSNSPSRHINYHFNCYEVILGILQEIGVLDEALSYCNLAQKLDEGNLEFLPLKQRIETTMD